MSCSEVAHGRRDLSVEWPIAYCFCDVSPNNLDVPPLVVGQLGIWLGDSWLAVLVVLLFGGLVACWFL